ncbi:hypothetical protein RIF29_39566 [Crotalaria pallida]|uniref:HTH myb-type domain-containing protein n=1 Tax=Crotalaria pallida TaxID=3830 RepID=A0AAN9HML6_CROPI
MSQSQEKHSAPVHGCTSWSSYSDDIRAAAATVAAKEKGHRNALQPRPTVQHKKGTTWTEFEHKLFLFGLEKLGKGDWKGISRTYVKSKTPCQVASHAQKYNLRQTVTNKKRKSIHDIVLDECDRFLLSAPDLDNQHNIVSLPQNPNQVLVDYSNTFPPNHNLMDQKSTFHLPQHDNIHFSNPNPNLNPIYQNRTFHFPQNDNILLSNPNLVDQPNTFQYDPCQDLVPFSSYPDHKNWVTTSQNQDLGYIDHQNWATTSQNQDVGINTSNIDHQNWATTSQHQDLGKNIENYKATNMGLVMNHDITTHQNSGFSQQVCDIPPQNWTSDMFQAQQTEHLHPPNNLRQPMLQWNPPNILPQQQEYEQVFNNGFLQCVP